jgi:hypothetical protein
MIFLLNADKRHIIIVVKNEVHGKGWLQINCRQLIYNHHNLQYQKAYSNGWNIIWDVLEKCKLMELKTATFLHRAILYLIYFRPGWKQKTQISKVQHRKTYTLNWMPESSTLKMPSSLNNVPESHMLYIQHDFDQEIMKCISVSVWQYMLFYSDKRAHVNHEFIKITGTSD